MSPMFSVVVGDQGSFGLGSGGPVVPDGCGEGEESLAGACEDARGGPGPVLFQAELAFERVENGLDPLTDAGQAAVPDGLAVAVRPHQVDPSRSVRNALNSLPAKPLSARITCPVRTR